MVPFADSSSNRTTAGAVADISPRQDTSTEKLAHPFFKEIFVVNLQARSYILFIGVFGPRPSFRFPAAIWPLEEPLTRGEASPMSDATKAAIEIVTRLASGGINRAGSGGAPKIPESVLKTVGEAATKGAPAAGSAITKIALEAIKVVTRR